MINFQTFSLNNENSKAISNLSNQFDQSPKNQNNDLKIDNKPSHENNDGNKQPLSKNLGNLKKNSVSSKESTPTLKNNNNELLNLNSNTLRTSILNDMNKRIPITNTNKNSSKTNLINTPDPLNSSNFSKSPPKTEIKSNQTNKNNIRVKSKESRERSREKDEKRTKRSSSVVNQETSVPKKPNTDYLEFNSLNGLNKLAISNELKATTMNEAYFSQRLKEEKAEMESLKLKFQSKLSLLEKEHEQEMNFLESRYNEYIVNLSIANEIKTQKLKLLHSSQEELLNEKIKQANENKEVSKLKEFNKIVMDNDKSNYSYINRCEEFSKKVIDKNKEKEKNVIAKESIDNKLANLEKLAKEINTQNTNEKEISTENYSQKNHQLLNEFNDLNFEMKIQSNLLYANAVKESIAGFSFDFLAKFSNLKKQLSLNKMKKVMAIHEEIQDFDNIKYYAIPDLFQKEEFLFMKTEIEQTKGSKFSVTKQERKITTREKNYMNSDENILNNMNNNKSDDKGRNSAISKKVVSNQLESIKVSVDYQKNNNNNNNTNYNNISNFNNNSNYNNNINYNNDPHNLSNINPNLENEEREIYSQNRKLRTSNQVTNNDMFYNQSNANQFTENNKLVNNTMLSNTPFEKKNVFNEELDISYTKSNISQNKRN